MNIALPRFVYLAGPIMNCTESEANDWRRYVAGQLAPHNIVGVSPLRCEPLHGDRYDISYPDKRFGVPKAIAAKNRFDTRSCDMGLFFIPKPAKPTDDEIEKAFVAWLEAGLYDDVPEPAKPTDDGLEKAFVAWLEARLHDDVPKLKSMREAFAAGAALPGKLHSFGTVGELFWMNADGKQTIVVSDDPFIHKHPVISAASSWQLDNFKDAIDVIVGVLGAYSGGKNV